MMGLCFGENLLGGGGLCRPIEQVVPFLKFTHETSEQKIYFLNVQVYKNGDKIENYVFYKKTDNHDYLPFNSCHPHHSKNNIPFVLARIICTIASDPAVRQRRLVELSSWLQSSGYPMDKIALCFENVLKIDQQTLRLKIAKEKENKLFLLTLTIPVTPQFLEI
jgi:hypothetical protein